jgi:hypothetical protein
VPLNRVPIDLGGRLRRCGGLLPLAAVIPPPVLMLGLVEVKRVPAWPVACPHAGHHGSQFLGVDGQAQAAVGACPQRCPDQGFPGGRYQDEKGVSARPSWLREPRHNPKVSPTLSRVPTTRRSAALGSNLDEGSRWWLCLQRTGLVLPPVTPRVYPGNVKVAAPTLQNSNHLPSPG